MNALNKKSVEDLDVKGKRVLVRCDFNVPLKDGEITNDKRIVAALPTIKYLMEQGAKVILCSHLGRPKGEYKPEFSLAPVAKRLSEYLGVDVPLAEDENVVGENAKKMAADLQDGQVMLLENVRYRAEETKNGEEFSKELADLADIYVCDAFGSSHRAHASVAGVTKFITAKGGENVVGYLMQKEIDFLGNAVNNPVRPFVAILGDVWPGRLYARCKVRRCIRQPGTWIRDGSDRSLHNRWCIRIGWTRKGILCNHRCSSL